MNLAQLQAKAVPGVGARLKRPRVHRAQRAQCGLLEELARARGHIVGKRYEQKAISLDKCTQIINGLSSSLDFDNGGEVVVNLARLYDYCVARLYTAGIKLDPTLIDEVTTLMTTIKRGWVGVQANNA